MGSIRKFVATVCGAAARAGLALTLAGIAMPAWAQSGFVEQPKDWQLGMVAGATPVRDAIDSFHNELVVIITLITVFVLGLLVYVMVRFSAKRHPVPSTTTHNTLLEVVWTAVPVLVLVSIAIPSFKLLYYENRTEHADMTLKVTGHQWYWSYEYPDQGDFAFDSNVLSEADDAKQGKPRLLGVDNPVVVPVGAVVRVLITGTDVIHSWYLPSAGVQEYAVVGRVNESWFQFERTGTFFGQCNQICGVNHPFMPIEVDVVSKDDFAKWAAAAKQKFATADSPPDAGVRLAAAQ
ncbi:MAG TPA: cytochrome c oxidase subunit II [Stellaceae bacterium]